MSYLGVSAELHYLSLPLGMTHCAALEISALKRHHDAIIRSIHPCLNQVEGY